MVSYQVSELMPHSSVPLAFLLFLGICTLRDASLVSPGLKWELFEVRGSNTVSALSSKIKSQHDDWEETFPRTFGLARLNTWVSSVYLRHSEGLYLLGACW